MLRLRRIFPSLVVSCLFLSVDASGEPNLSGQWKLNVQRSDFGELEGTGSLFSPEEATLAIDHQGSQIRISLHHQGRTGEIRSELTFLTDGSECSNKLEDGSLTSRLHWEGDLLKIESRFAFEPFNPDMDESWELSPDGTTLIIKREMKAMGADLYQRFVFEKQ